MYDIKKRVICTLMITALLFLTACGSNNDDPPVVEEPSVQIGEAQPQIDVSDITQADADIDEDYENIEEGYEDVEEAEDISLEEFIANAIEENSNRISGLAVTVFTEDDIILELQHGYADIAAGLAIDSDTVFGWGSITKLLVYVSAMQLYERGELDLHADIFTYISQEFFPNIVYPVTMHHLINHTAGFEIFINSAGGLYEQDALLIQTPFGEPLLTLEDALKGVFSREFIAQTSQPGERFSYSNEGIALAGYVIAQISGMPFYEYVHKNIFAPLEMTHTALLPDLSDNEWVSMQRDKVKVYRFTGREERSMQREQIHIYPTGAAVGTISDMIRFARALMPDENGASVLFERPETMSKLYPSLEEIQNLPFCAISGVRYFNGFSILHPVGESGRLLGHGGGTRGFSSFLLIDIDRGIGWVMSENRRDGLWSVDGFLPGFLEVVF